MQLAFSVAETIAEQNELIADFMSFDDVRTGFPPKRKSANLPNLSDRELRGRVLTAVMRSLAKQKKTGPEALDTLTLLLSRYLHYFTRHTGDNIRDGGTPYLKGRWPTDLQGRLFFDCGVYAVETAFDMMRAARAFPGLTLEFRFLVFLGHVALVVYEGKTSFCVNNAEIFAAAPWPAPTKYLNSRDGAGFSWATNAMQGAFSARFAITLVALHPASLSSNVSELKFKSDIWTMYQSILTLDIDAAIGDKYAKSVEAFEAGSGTLTAYITELKGLSDRTPRANEFADSLTRATNLTDKLYALADAIADPCNYLELKSTQFLLKIGAHVSRDDERIQRAQLGGELPMYGLVEFLKTIPAQKLTSLQQGLVGKSTGRDHAQMLTDRFNPRPNCKKRVKALAADHDSSQKDVQTLVESAPDRIKLDSGAMKAAAQKEP
jgi:hypothetical protein